MLQRLHIRNFAIIDELELRLEAGFTALTGETGAGKSILIDAIGLLLGDRADTSMVRAGAERADIQAEWDLQRCPDASTWLREMELVDPDDEAHCLIRRVISSEGRTRAFINGSAVQLTALRELGETLIEIHGQHEHQRLVRPDVQRELLDAFLGDETPLQAVRENAAKLRKLEQSLTQAREAGARDPAELDFLRYQIEELDALGLKPGELEQIDEEHRQLANAGQLIQEGGVCLEALTEADGAVIDQVGRLEQHLTQLGRMHGGFAEVSELLNSAGIQLQEAAAQLRRMVERLDLDPERLAQLEDKLAAIQDLSRKHHVRSNELLQRRDELAEQLQASESAASALSSLEVERDRMLAEYRRSADVLSAARREAATQFAAAASAITRELGMSQATLEVAVEAQADRPPRSHGQDDIRLDFSANPGQPPRPLAKIASGGELSRISLAIQVAATGSRQVPVMIFDEVDSGVGGGVAQMVGERLRQLAEQRQILCVTHLPQVAAQGHHQMRISKQVAGGQTRTQVLALDEAQREQELARMLGGVEITERSRAHAREMLEQVSSS